MNLSKEEREELSNLSQELTGRRSFWQSVLKHGILQPFFEPGQRAPVRQVKYMDVTEVKAYLLDLKKQMEEAKAKMIEAEKIKETEAQKVEA